MLYNPDNYTYYKNIKLIGPKYVNCIYNIKRENLYSGFKQFYNNVKILKRNMKSKIMQIIKAYIKNVK